MTRTRSSSEIRDASRREIVRALVVGGTATRNDLARSTGLSAATVSNLVTELREAGLIADAGTDNAGTGRPTTVLRIDGEGGSFLGIDVAETYIRAVVFDAALTEIGAADVDVDEAWSSVDRVAEALVKAVDQALDRGGRHHDDILGVGLGLPGIVSRDPRGAASPQGWAAQVRELEHRVRPRLPSPVVTANPLQAVGHSEIWFGTARGRSSAVVVNLGTGVGAGIIVEGRVLRGATSTAGEWGHTVLELDGRMCRCGRRGCVEAYVGVPGIRHTLRDVEAAHPLLRLHQRDFIRGLRNAVDDPAASETLAHTARYLGIALSDIVAVLNPEVLTLTGWTAWALGDALLPGARAALAERAPELTAARLDLGVSPVRINSVATGMAVLAFENHLDSQALARRSRPRADPIIPPDTLTPPALPQTPQPIAG
ncbi:Sugar kinase of the NBD/HSP70 family, may contain an N-terminal HTH domain [Microbacterium sp. LKL04]|uniref:ROK family transcriptional regulator n=1 Tax=Microbacterium sp. LKL04 TaxID=912630 RepID=UPI000875C4AF|nr:ROK family transcriptional regulator [Microbacterium sp. LKL04]SCY20755.1 Sugar kinase of the NBD/HSP70 family, may contain an N-terminal HTH domain [Microbacterium sp. LKL04]